MTASAKGALGKHIENAPPDAVEFVWKSLYILEPLYSTIMLLTKLSVLCFYHRVFKHTTHRTLRYSLWIIGIVTALWYVAVLLVGILQCIPVAKSWDQTLSGKCINIKGFFIGQVSDHPRMPSGTNQIVVADNPMIP